MGIFLLVFLLVPLLTVVLYVISAGPVLHCSFGSGSFPAIYQIYGPVLNLDPMKPVGRAFWAYMHLWGFYPGGAFG